MPKTIRERLLAGLDALGYTRPKKRTPNKYEMYADPAGGNLYIGKAGAFRKGATIAGSIPVQPRFRERVLAAGDEALTDRRKGVSR